MFSKANSNNELVWCIKNRKSIPLRQVRRAPKKIQKIWKKFKQTCRSSLPEVSVRLSVGLCHGESHRSCDTSCLCGSEIFIVGILWIQNIFSWVFCGSKIVWLSIHLSIKTKSNIRLWNFKWEVQVNSFYNGYLLTIVFIKQIL